MRRCNSFRVVVLRDTSVGFDCCTRNGSSTTVSGSAVVQDDRIRRPIECLVIHTQSQMNGHLLWLRFLYNLDVGCIAIRASSFPFRNNSSSRYIYPPIYLAVAHLMMSFLPLIDGAIETRLKAITYWSQLASAAINSEPLDSFFGISLLTSCIISNNAFLGLVCLSYFV